MLSPSRSSTSPSTFTTHSKRADSLEWVGQTSSVFRLQASSEGVVAGVSGQENGPRLNEIQFCKGSARVVHLRPTSCSARSPPCPPRSVSGTRPRRYPATRTSKTTPTPASMPMAAWPSSALTLSCDATGSATGTFSTPGPTDYDGTTMYLAQSFRYDTSASSYNDFNDSSSYIWNIAADSYCGGNGVAPGAWLGTWSSDEYGPYSSSSTGARAVWALAYQSPSSAAHRPTATTSSVPMGLRSGRLRRSTVPRKLLTTISAEPSMRKA